MTILFFPNGTIQCVGSCNDEDVNHMHSVLEDLLKTSLPKWDVKTMTVLCEFKHRYDFRNVSSSAHVTYEVEIFPAAQMTIWNPYHVHVFHNGKIVITGIKDMSTVQTIIGDLKNYVIKSK